jgi:trigger factor
MQVVETKNEGLCREFKITLLAAEIEDKINARLEELRKTANIAGFRPGKVPVAIMKQRYGGSVMGEVLEQAVSDSSQQAMAEHTLRPALQPKIEIQNFDPGKDLEYTMSVEVMPVIEPMDFKKIDVERQVVEVSDTPIDETVERLAKQYRASEPIKGSRKSKKGDVLVIDFVGSVDGETFEGGAGTDHHLELGASQFIEGFEDQLIGIKVGEKASVSVTFPDEYVNAELAGKSAVFEVDIKEIREMADTVIDDEFAKTMGQESLADLRKAIGEQIGQDYSRLSRERLKRDLLDQLEKHHDFELPPGMVDAEFEAIWTQFEEARKNNELDQDDAENKTDDELKEEYRKIGARRVLLGLLLTEVGTTNNIEVSAEEINRALMEEARKYPGQEQAFIKMYQENPEAMASIRAPIFEEKVVDFILEMANVTERKVSLEALMAAPEEAK